KERIKRADMVTAFYEATLLAGFEEEEAVRFFGRPRSITAEIANFKPTPTKDAQLQFLSTFNHIESSRTRA
ncbi:MAG: hydrolase, partial [Notoacmeibacter sp.]